MSASSNAAWAFRLPSLPVHLHHPSAATRPLILDAFHRFLTGLDTPDAVLFASAFSPYAFLQLNNYNNNNDNNTPKTFSGIDAIRAGLFERVGTGMNTTHQATGFRIHVIRGPGRLDSRNYDGSLEANREWQAWRDEVNCAQAFFTATVTVQGFPAGKVASRKQEQDEHQEEHQQGGASTEPRLLGGDLYWVEVEKEFRGVRMDEPTGLWRITNLVVKSNWTEGDWSVVGGE